MYDMTCLYMFNLPEAVRLLHFGRLAHDPPQYSDFLGLGYPVPVLATCW